MALTGGHGRLATAKTDVAGIKEALAMGTEKAVNSLAKANGYFGNRA